MVRPNAQLTELRQYIEDMSAGLAMRFDDLDRRLRRLVADHTVKTIVVDVPLWL